MLKLLAILSALLVIQEVPYKPNEEFEIKLDYKFKQRPPVEINKVSFDDGKYEPSHSRSTGMMLPFLTLNIRMLKLNDNEVKVRITNDMNGKVAIRKLDTESVIPIEIGFTDDVKDRVTAHQYTLTLISSKKVGTSRIFIDIDKDGTFNVNGEKRGKF